MIQTKTLSNGVRVIVKRMEGLLSVSMGVLVGTGAAFESDREDGISHFKAFSDNVRISRLHAGHFFTMLLRRLGFAK